MYPIASMFLSPELCPQFTLAYIHSFGVSIRTKGQTYTFMSVRQVKCSSCYDLTFKCLFTLLYCCTVWKPIKHQQSLNFLEETNKTHMTPEDCYSFYAADSKLGITKHFSFWPDHLSFQATDEIKQA